MSGFFDNLLSRSRGTADVVRPRLASLFEPGEPRPSHLAGEPSVDAEQDVDDAPFAEGRANTAAPFAASFASQGLTHSHAVGLHRASLHELGGHDINARDDSHADADARRSARGHLGMSMDGDGRGAGERSDRGGDRRHHAAALAGLDGGDARARDGSGHASLIRAAMDALVERGLLRGSNGALAGDSHLAQGAGAAQHSGRNAGTIAASMPSSTSTSTSASTPTSTLFPTPAATPTPRFHFEPAGPGRAHAGGAAASEPIVEINIGRIEIRAAVERGSDRKAAATPSPVMALDEYLQTRARGGSR